MSVPVIWYHGTSVEMWAQIQREGVLWGVREQFGGRVPIRCSYLATTEEEARSYGSVVLRIRYVPRGPVRPKGKRRGIVDNYCLGCWQIRVYVPIPLSKIEMVI